MSILPHKHTKQTNISSAVYLNYNIMEIITRDEMWLVKLK